MLVIRGQSGDVRVTTSRISDRTGNTASMLADISEEMTKVGREYKILKGRMEDYFDTLPPKHRDIMTLRYIFELSTTEIGRMVGASHQYISKVVTKNS